MSLTGKYISIERIIEKVYRDNGFPVKLDWGDMIEWAGEAIDLIGVPMAFLDKVTGQDAQNPTIKIVSYKGLLPCDLHLIIQTREYCSKTPMRYTTDSFHTTYHVGRSLDFTTNSDYTYHVNNNYIFTSFETGEVEMSYKAFPTDEKGFPKIPDNIKFIQAVATYIAERIAYRMFIRNEIDRQRYELVQSERLYYMGAAKTAGIMPSIDQMESLKNSFMRAIPKVSEGDTGFAYLGQQSERWIK